MLFLWVWKGPVEKCTFNNNNSYYCDYYYVPHRYWELFHIKSNKNLLKFTSWRISLCSCDHRPKKYNARRLTLMNPQTTQQRSAPEKCTWFSCVLHSCSTSSSFVLLCFFFVCLEPSGSLISYRIDGRPCSSPTYDLVLAWAAALAEIHRKRKKKRRLVGWTLSGTACHRSLAAFGGDRQCIKCLAV